MSEIIYAIQRASHDTCTNPITFFWDGISFNIDRTKAMKFTSEKIAKDEIANRKMIECYVDVLWPIAMKAEPINNASHFGAPQGPESRQQVKDRIDAMEIRIIQLNEAIKSVQWDLDIAKPVYNHPIIGEKFRDMLEYQQAYVVSKYILVAIDEEHSEVVRIVRSPFQEVPSNSPVEVVEDCVPVLVGVDSEHDEATIDAFSDQVWDGKVVGIWDTYREYLDEIVKFANEKAEEESKPGRKRSLKEPDRCPYGNNEMKYSHSQPQCIQCPFSDFCCDPDDDDEFDED